jgi:hypothetical protein
MELVSELISLKPAQLDSFLESTEISTVFDLIYNGLQMETDQYYQTKCISFLGVFVSALHDNLVNVSDNGLV